MKVRILAVPGGGIAVESETEAESDFLGFLNKPTVEKTASMRGRLTLVISGNPSDPLTPPVADA